MHTNAQFVLEESTIHSCHKYICDSLKIDLELKGKIDDSDYDKYLKSFALKNPVGLYKEIEYFRSSHNNSHNTFDKYFAFQLNLECPCYRVVQDENDKYLEDQPNKREQYLISNDFINSLNDYATIDSLLIYFENVDDSLKKRLTTIHEIFNLIKNDVYMSNIWIGENGNTFKCYYYDVILKEPAFEIKINFKDYQDNLIDEVSYKDREILKREKQEREFDNNIPPPPPPPPGLNSNK